MMRRREFITLLGGAALVWPIKSSAQERGKMRVIGYMGSTTPSAQSPWTAPFLRRLREHGWIERHNLLIEYRWGEGRNDRFAEIAAEFARLNVDVIVTYSAAPVLAAKQATSAIPIIFAAAPDPLGSGLVASLAHPGGNVTGLSTQSTDLAGKRLEFLREIVPAVRRLVIMANIGNPGAVQEMSEVQAACRVLHIEFVNLEIRRAEEIEPVLKALEREADALYVCAEPLVNANRTRINSLALGLRLPAIYAFREYVEAGGLMSYGANAPDLFRRAADIVDKVLRGTKPSDIPVEQPTKFDLVINLKTAKTLGLTIPEFFLLRADEVIE